MNEFDLAQNAKNKRIRRDLLRALHTARGSFGGGELNGQTLFDLFGPNGVAADQLTDERHARELLADLCSKGLADISDARTYKWQRESLAFLTYTITAKGVSLIEQTIDADPDIEDDRIHPRNPRK